MQPVFWIKGWAGEAPSKIVVGGRPLEQGKEFSASVATEFLLLQLLEPVRDLRGILADEKWLQVFIDRGRHNARTLRKRCAPERGSQHEWRDYFVPFVPDRHQ